MGYSDVNSVRLARCTNREERTVDREIVERSWQIVRARITGTFTRGCLHVTSEEQIRVFIWCVKLLALCVSLSAALQPTISANFSCVTRHRLRVSHLHAYTPVCVRSYVRVCVCLIGARGRACARATTCMTNSVILPERKRRQGDDQPGRWSPCTVGKVGR